MRALTNSEKKKKRQEEILWSLGVMRFATREHIQQMHSLGTDRNALKVLNELKDYLHIQNHEGKNVYYLNAKGRELVDIKKEEKWSLQAEHHLLRNDMYLFYNKPTDWAVEQEITIYATGLMTQDKYIRPDAHFKKDGRYHFLEVDRTQNMADNKKKIDLYAELSVAIQNQFGYRPVIIFYTLTPIRRDTLKNQCEKLKLICEVHSKEDLR